MAGHWTCFSLSFSQRVRFFFLQRLERRNLVFVWEREKRTIHLHTLALWALAKKKKKKAIPQSCLSFFLRGFVLFPSSSSLLGSPLCYEVSVTRFAHIQFGPCHRCCWKKITKQKMGASANSSSFLNIYLAVKNWISRQVKIRGRHFLKKRTSKILPSLLLLRLLVALFFQVSAADERRNARRSGVSAVGCLYIFADAYPRLKRSWGVLHEEKQNKNTNRNKSYCFFVCFFLFWVGYWLASRTKLFVCPFSFFPSSFILRSVGGGHLKIHTRNKQKEAKKGPYAWKGTQNSYRFLSPFTIQRNSLGLVVCHFDFFLLFIAWARWQIDAPCSHIFKGESLTLWYLKKKKTQIFETNLLKRSIHFAFLFFVFCFFFFK